MPGNVNVVLEGLMHFQTTSRFALIFALITFVPCDANVVFEGLMPFQTTSLFCIDIRIDHICAM